MDKEMDIDSQWKGDLPSTPTQEQEDGYSPVKDLTVSQIQSELDNLYDQASSNHSDADYDIFDYLDEVDVERVRALRNELSRRRNGR